MKITDIREDMLPLFVVEELMGTSWHHLSHQPFATREEAEADRAKLVAAYHSIEPAKVRVGDYTLSNWRDDLICLILDDEDGAYKALEQLHVCELLPLARVASGDCLERKGGK